MVFDLGASWKGPDVIELPRNISSIAKDNRRHLIASCTAGDLG